MCGKLLCWGAAPVAAGCLAGKIISAVCHGPAGLVLAKGPDGSFPLVKGKKVTGFTNSEEEAVGKTKVRRSGACDGLNTSTAAAHFYKQRGVGVCTRW